MMKTSTIKDRGYGNLPGFLNLYKVEIFPLRIH